MGGVLGANVMRDHNVVFDYDNHLVGFAEGICDYRADVLDAGPGEAVGVRFSLARWFGFLPSFFLCFCYSTVFTWQTTRVCVGSINSGDVAHHACLWAQSTLSCLASTCVCLSVSDLPCRRRQHVLVPGIAFHLSEFARALVKSRTFGCAFRVIGVFCVHAACSSVSML